MSFIDMNLGSDVQEPKTAPEGWYDLVIINASPHTKEGENRPSSTAVFVKISDHPEYRPVSVYLGYSKPTDENQTRAFKQLMTKRFLSMFSIPFEDGGYATEDLLGATAKGYLTLTEANENGDVYNQLRFEKLSGEE